MSKGTHGYRYVRDSGLVLSEIKVSQIAKVLGKLREQYACQGWRDIVPVMSAVQTVLDNFELVEVVDDSGTSLMAYSAETPWFTGECILVEEFVVGDADLSTVVDAMAALAKIHGCSRLVLGTRAVRGAKHGALARLYERTGCVVSCMELTKEVP